MLQLYLRYYPTQGSTQFIGDLFLGGTSRTCSRLIKILKELRSSGKILIELSKSGKGTDPMSRLVDMDYETFKLVELKFYDGLDRLKFERKKNTLIIHLNPYTLTELIEGLEILKVDTVDYGMDAFELVFENGQVKRSNRRLWFVKV